MTRFLHAIVGCGVVFLACSLDAPRAGMEWQLIDAGRPIAGDFTQLVHRGATGETFLRIETSRMVPQMWVLENDVWNRRLEETYPTPAFGPSFVYDPDRDVIVRFGGGARDNTVLSETWEYDGTTWTLRTDVGTPPGRNRAMMAYDTDRRLVVLYGGLGDAPGGGFTQLGDVWEYDGVAWTEVTPPLPHPTPRESAAWAYDEARGRLVLAFGFNGSVGWLPDTWEFDGSVWIIPPPGPGMAPRLAPAAAYDPSTGAVCVFGGGAEPRTISWTGAAWEEVSSPAEPPQRNYGSMVFDTTRSKLVLANGLDGGSTYPDAWTFDGANWVELPQPSGAPGLRSAALTFDDGRGVGILQGGTDCCINDMGLQSDATWEWNGTTWTEVVGATGAGKRNGHRMIYDRQNASPLSFGGGFVTATDHTWDYDAGIGDWVERTTSPPPAPRYDMGLAFRDSDDTTVLFGGVDDNATHYDDTWFLNGARWEEVPTTIAPSIRYAPAMAYDPGRDEIILYGGDPPGSTALSDTWALRGSTWVELPVAGPGGRQTHAMVYDSSRGVMVLAGGLQPGVGTEETWEFDGTTWSAVTTKYSPDMHRQDFGMAWDPVREVVVLYGGEAGTWQHYNDTWVYGPDDDDDGRVGGYDNCPASPNPSQENHDGDAAGDACDCASADPDVFAVPGEVAGLTLEGGSPTTLSWDEQASTAGTGVVYDVVTGDLADLGGAGFAVATCHESDATTPTSTDARVPAAGAGFYYLVRGRTTCGAGTFGVGREDLDGASPCP